MMNLAEISDQLYDIVDELRDILDKVDNTEVRLALLNSKGQVTKAATLLVNMQIQERRSKTRMTEKNKNIHLH